MKTVNRKDKIMNDVESQLPFIQIGFVTEIKIELLIAAENSDRDCEQEEDDDFYLFIFHRLFNISEHGNTGSGQIPFAIIYLFY